MNTYCMPGTVLEDLGLLEHKTDKNPCLHETWVFDL